MQEIVKEISYSDKKELVREIRKYSSSFSRAVRSVLGGFQSPRVDADAYDSVLKSSTEKEFPNARQPLYQIVHWMLLDNGLIDYSASISFDRKNGERKDGSAVSKRSEANGDIDRIVKKDVKRYIVTILARAEGTEKAEKFVPKKTFNWNGSSNGQHTDKKD